MIDGYLEQLLSPDAEQRRSAIVALAKAKDPLALPALGRIYKEDPVPELRELALKAGRYIKQAQEPDAGDILPRSDSQSSALPPRTESKIRALAPRTDSQTGVMPPRTPSKQEEARAHSYLDTALNYYSAGDRQRAIESLGRAFELNPLIYKEAVAANLAQTLTGLGHDEAIALLTDPYRRKAFAASVPGAEVVYGSGKAKRGAAGMYQKMVTWIDILLDLALFWLVVSIALTAVLGLGIKTLVDDYGDEMIEASAQNPTPLTREDLDTLRDLSVIGMLFASMTVAVSYSFSLLINGIAIHIAATMMLGGKNSFVDFLHKYIPFMTILALIMGGAGVLAILLLSPAPAISSLIGTLMGIGGLVSILVLAWLIGNVYGFAMPYGCAAMILSIVVSGVLGCLFYLALSTLLGGSGSAILILAH